MKTDNFLKKFKISDITLYLIFIGVVLVFVVLNRLNGVQFLKWTNISNIIVQATIIAIVSIGASIVILTGGIDLSVGAIVGLVGASSAMLMNAGVSITLSCIIGILLGGFIGFINGIGVNIGKIPAFIMTLGMSGLISGARLALTGGKPVTGMPLELGNIANATIGPIPIFIIYVIVIYSVIVFIMTKTKFGRRIYAVGGNRSAAQLSGVSVKRIEIATYTLSGLFSGIGGILLVSRLCYAAATAGDTYVMDCIAAAVIGGISLSGGQGKVRNTLLGALLLSVLKAGLQMLNVLVAYQQIATGNIIILAVFLDKAKERKAE